MYMSSVVPCGDAICWSLAVVVFSFCAVLCCAMTVMLPPVGVYLLLSSCDVRNMFSPFSPPAAVSLCGVADLEKTCPSLRCSGPFLPDAPRFHVSPDRIVQRPKPKKVNEIPLSEV